MKPSLGLKPRLLLAGLLAAMTGVSVLSAAQADPSTHEGEQPLQVQLTTTLNAETAHYGDPFTGVLTQAYTVNDKSLPAGTVFKGHVQRARKSLPLGMPGYVVLDIDEAQLPSGAVHHFEQGKAAPQSTRIVNSTVKTRKAMLKDSSPYAVISTATSIPLRYAAGLNPWTIVPIALGSRIALGVAMHVKHHNALALAQQPANTLTIQSPVGQGIVDGSGLNAAYYFLSTAPEPVLTEGTVVPLHFRSHALTSLLSAAETTPAQAQAQEQDKRQAQPMPAARAQEAVSQPRHTALFENPVVQAQPQQATLVPTPNTAVLPATKP